MGKRMSRKGILITVSAIIILAGGGFAYSQLQSVDEDTATTPEMQTYKVRRGDLTIVASGTGTLISENAIQLGFGTSGEIAELFVSLGDEVAAGDVLAIQDDRHQLAANITAAELVILEAQDALDSLYENADLVEAKAKLALAEAEETRDNAEYIWQVNQAGQRASEATMIIAEANLVIAQSNLERSQDKLNNYSSAPANDPNKAHAQISYANAMNQVSTALRNLNWYTGHPDEIEQSMLDAELAIAEANFIAAQHSFDHVQDGPPTEDIQKAELTLANAQTQLQTAQEIHDLSTMRAPFTGTILEITAAAGESVTKDFITLADLSQPALVVYLDETDMNLIGVDYEIEVIFDAFPDDVFTGSILRVNPALFSSGNTKMVQAFAELTPSDSFDYATLLLGLNAAVEVIAGQAENAILVPYEALRDLGEGEYAVFVVDDDGELKMRMVEVGIMDYLSVEIVAGLEAGEIVSTGIVETQQ